MNVWCMRMDGPSTQREVMTMSSMFLTMLALKELLLPPSPPLLLLLTSFFMLAMVVLLVLLS